MSWVDLKTIKDKILHILERSPESRDSELKLIANIWINELKKIGKDPKEMTGYDLLGIIAGGRLTHPESIRRSRQKIQQHEIKKRGKLYQERHGRSAIIKEQLRAF